MKISPVTPDLHRNISFKSTAGGTLNQHPNYDNNNQSRNPHPSHGCLRSLGNGLYWGLVLNTLVITPIMEHNLDKTWQRKLEFEQSVNKDYYELSDKLKKEEGKSTAHFNINKLHDVDDAFIMKSSPNKYLASFDLDKQTINMHMKINEQNKDSISGVMIIKEKHDNDSVVWINDYSIKFSDEDVHDFTMTIQSREDNSSPKNIQFHRNYNELYMIENGQKRVLNSKNIKAYEERIKKEELNNEMYETGKSNNRITLLFLIFLTLIKMRSAQKRTQQQ